VLKKLLRRVVPLCHAVALVVDAVLFGMTILNLVGLL
jgi:hypothetical protein